MKRYISFLPLLRILLFTSVLLSAHIGLAQDRSDVVSAFNAAAAEFGIPADILKAIAFSETRWEHLVWFEGDTASCMGVPHPYGVMALRDDAFFGSSLRTSAALIGEDPEVVRTDLRANVRAAAAYLKKLYSETPRSIGSPAGSLESWQNAIAAYCGIPQRELAAQHAYEVLARLARGYNEYGISMEQKLLNMTLVRSTAQRAYQEAALQRGVLQKSTDQPDYPDAHWAPAYPGHWYTTGYGKYFVVVHDMEGYYAGVISYFQQSGTQASIHYDINGLQDSPSDAPAGDITQQVEEQYYAWHAVCLNRYSLGIEHEGFVSNPAWWTPEMYVASGKLIKHMCDKFGIPKDRNHIIGHNEYLNSSWVTWANANAVPAGQLPADFASCNSHTDPGVNWDWTFLMQLITEDKTPPRVTSTPPVTGIQVYDKISVTFNQRMERASTQANFRVSPVTSGTFAWTNNSRTLVFTPSSYLPFATDFTVTIDTGAHNYTGVGLDVNGDGIASGEPYSFTFHTVQQDTIPPLFAATYPTDLQLALSPSMEFIVDINEPLDPASITVDDFSLRDSTGAGVALSAPTASIVGSTMRIRLRPSVSLLPGAVYTLTILPTMVDYGGNSLDAVRTVRFTTEVPQSLDGTIIDAMDAVGGWKAPSYSGTTTGVSATFGISTSFKKTGTGSGKIDYTFTNSSGGVIREYNLNEPVIDAGSIFGMWIHGDRSMNELRYAAYYWNASGTKTYTTVTIGNIDWTGWKLKTMPLSSVPVGNGTARKFAGLLLYQKAGASPSGTLYFDELRSGNTLTDVEDAKRAAEIPEGFALSPNYPNPFNPETVVRFQVPVVSHISLRIYDFLGREVAVLVNEEKAPGTYAVSWNASDMASGMYFCRMTAGQFTQSHRMVLVK